MAISDSIPDVAVTIQVGDEALHEYVSNENDESQTDKKVVRYIEVAPNMKFEIHADLHAIPANFYREDEPLEEVKTRIGPQFGLAWYIVVDGKELDSVLLHDSMVKAYYSTGNTCLSRHARSGSELRPYQFSSIKEGGSKKDSLGEEELGKLGTIQIIVHHVEIFGLVVQEDYQKRDVGPLDEAAIKGREVETIVSLGEPVEGTLPAFYTDCTPVGPDNPVAVYEFRYRSKAELQKLNIIPRAEEPERQPEAQDDDRDLESMSPEEQLAELKRLRAAERERGDQTIRIKEEIRENASRAGPSRRKGPTTVIVLGDDGEIEEEYEKPATPRDPAGPTMDLESDDSDG